MGAEQIEHLGDTAVCHSVSPDSFGRLPAIMNRATISSWICLTTWQPSIPGAKDQTSVVFP
jgi:hypothetical protein